METIKDLTPRQWKLYEFMKLGIEYDTQQDFLMAYEYSVLLEACKYSYGYFDDVSAGVDWNNMSSARNLRKDLLAIRESDLIQKIIVKNKIATTVEEAHTHLENRLKTILNQLKIYWKEKAKLEKHYQTRLTFGVERDFIEAVLPKMTVETDE